MESRYRYSNKLVYNNFPWPQAVTEKQKTTVAQLAQRILELRIECGDGRTGFLPAAGTGTTPCTLADLYDPLTMPTSLVKAHAELDRAVDACYRAQPFVGERQRVEYLFALYESLIAPLIGTPKQRRNRKPLP